MASDDRLVRPLPGLGREAQEELLKAQGRDAAQGWLYGRPQSAEQIDRAFGLAPARVALSG